MTRREQKLKELEMSIRKMEEENYKEFGELPKKKKKRKKIFRFILGLLMVSTGIFFAIKEATFSYDLSKLNILGIFIPWYLILIPFILGLVFMFICKKKIIPSIFTLLGIMLCCYAVATTTTIEWNQTPLYAFIAIILTITIGVSILIDTTLLNK